LSEVWLSLQDMKRELCSLDSDQSPGGYKHPLGAPQIRVRDFRSILRITGLGAAVISKRYAESRDSRQFWLNPAVWPPMAKSTNHIDCS